MFQQGGDVIGDSFAKAMLRELPNVKPIPVEASEKDKESVQKLIDAVDDMGKAVDAELEDQTEVLRRILSEIRNLRSITHRADRRERSATGNRGSSSAGTGGSGRSRSTSDILSNVSVRRAGRAGGAGGGGAASPIGDIKKIDPSALVRKLGMANIGTMLGTVMMGAMGQALDSFVQSTGVRLSGVFDGMFAEEFSFATDMKAIVNSTREYGQELKTAQGEALDLGLVTREIGFGRQEFQNALMKSSRKGFVTEMRYGKMTKQTYEDQQLVLKNSLSTAYALNMESGSTAEMFDRWQKSLQLNNMQLYQVGRSMQHISRETGVTGDALAAAVQSSESMFKNMKKAGVLTESTMSTVIRSQALATKYGVEELDSAINQGLASYNEMLKMQDKNLQAFLIRAIQGSQELSSAWKAGMALDETFKPQFNDAILKQMQTNLGQVGMGNMDVSKLDQEMQLLRTDYVKATQAGDKALAKSISDRIFRAETLLENLGMSLGEMEAMAKKLREEAKTPAQRITDLNAQLASAATGEGKAAIQRDIASIQQSIARKMMGDMDLALSSGRSMDEALENARSTLIGSGMDIAGATNAQAMEQMFSQTLTHMESELSRLGKNSGDLLRESGFESFDQLQTALMSGDGSQRELGIKAFQSLENVISTQAKDEMNPINEINQNIREINDNIKFMVGGTIVGLSATALLAVIGGAIGLKTGSTIMGGAQLFKTLSSFTKRGGVAAASGADDVVAGANAAATGTRAAGTVADVATTSTKAGGMLGKASGMMGKAGGFVSKMGMPIAKAVGMGGARAGLIAGSGGTLAIALAAVDGLMGAFNGFSNTAENFKDILGEGEGQFKEVSWAMRGASTWAGMLTGILDGLSFGLLGLVGLKQPIEKIFSYIYFAIMHPIEKLFVGIKNGFMAGIAPIVERLSATWEKFKAAFSTLGAKLGEAFGKIAKALGFDGASFGSTMEAVGWAAEQAGWFIGFALVPAVNILVASLEWLIWGFTKAAEYAVWWIDSVMGFAEGVTKFFKGDFQGVWDDFSGWIVRSVKGIGGFVGELFGNLWKFLPSEEFGTMLGDVFMWGLDFYWSYWTETVPSMFGTLFQWFFMSLPGYLMQGGRYIVAAAPKVFAYIWDSMKLGFVTVMDNLKIQFIETLDSIVEYIKDIPNKIKNQVVDTATDVAAEATTTGGMVGGGLGFALGGPMGAAAGFAAAKVAGFDVGTNEVKKGGLAFIHQGEAIVPKDQTDILAQGSGSFNSEKVASSYSERGAFDGSSVVDEAFYQFGRLTKMAGVDLNDVFESAKESIANTPIGAATKSLYLTENRDDIDAQLDRAMTQQDTNRVAAGTMMYTPEDAADYIYQQLAGSTPSSSASMGALDVIASLNEQQLQVQRETLEQLRELNRNQGGSMNFFGGADAEQLEGITLGLKQKSNSYKKSTLRGYWQDIQSVPSNPQDNYENRPA